MKKLLFFPLAALIISSCSSFSIKNEIDKTDKLKPVKKTGIFFRIPKRTFVNEKDYRQTLHYWVEGYQQLKKITLLTGISSEMGLYTSGQNRFYQLNENRDFLKFKSLGVVKSYLQAHKTEIDGIMASNNLDALVVYEVDGFFQAQLQHVEFNSLIVIVDKSMNVLFMERQDNTYPDVDEINPEKIKKHLLDKVSQRFIEAMTDIDFLKEK